MRRLLVSLALTACCAMGQSALTLDLSGDWRRSPGDEASMAPAQAGFDDRQWPTVRLPWGKRPEPYAFFWLRKTVDLPASFDRGEALWLTLGGLREVYAVYVNGQPIATVGDFDSFANAQLPRTRSFRVPASAIAGGGRLSLAIKIGRGSGSPFLFRPPDRGPYRLTNGSLEARDAGREELTLWRERFTPSLILAAVNLVLGILLLMAWMAERERRELLLLAMLLGSYSLYAVYMVTRLSPEATPYLREGAALVQHLLRASTWGLLTSFVVRALGFRERWPHVLGWSIVGLIPICFLVLGLQGELAYYRMSGLLLAVMGLVAVLVAGWRLRRGGQRVSTWVLWAVLAALVLERLVTAVGTMLTASDFSQQYVELGGYYFFRSEWLSLAVSVAILLLLLRQMSADRQSRERLQGEMESARGAQMFLLGMNEGRNEGPVRQGAFEVETVYEPALEVGGDFHWTRTLPDGSLVAVVGDVSGKGLKAAMLVSAAIGILRNEKSTSPGEVLGALNDGLAGHTGGGFVTCCCARFAADGKVTIASAGHPAPYADGRELEVPAGLPLGVLPGVAYDEWAVSGHRFMFVTDGVMEAENSRRELFGFDRTREVSKRSTQEIADAARAWGQNDDITVVTVRRIG